MAIILGLIIGTIATIVGSTLGAKLAETGVDMSFMSPAFVGMWLGIILLSTAIGFAIANEID